MVGWQSGRMRHLGKVVSEQSLQGFESLTYLDLYYVSIYNFPSHIIQDVIKYLD